MAGMNVTATHKDALAFDVDVKGFAIGVDADPSHGGGNNGPPPKSLLLAALAGCTGMDVAAILGKMRMPYDSFRLELSGEARDEHPKTFRTVHVRYIFSGSELDAEKIEKAIDLSLTKYCPVAATLKHTAEITHELVLR